MTSPSPTTHRSPEKLLPLPMATGSSWGSGSSPDSSQVTGSGRSLGAQSLSSLSTIILRPIRRCFGRVCSLLRRFTHLTPPSGLDHHIQGFSFTISIALQKRVQGRGLLSSNHAGPQGCQSGKSLPRTAPWPQRSCLAVDITSVH